MMRALILFQMMTALPPDGVFQSANGAYEKGKYEEARVGYESLVEEGRASAELYFNLGNTYFKLKRIGPAILYYEKALRLDPSDADIRANLELAELRRRDKMIIPPDFFVFALLREIRDGLSFSTWTWITLLLWHVVNVVLMAGYAGWWKTPRRIRRTLVIVFVVFCIGTFSRWAHENSNREAVILAAVVDARNEPTHQASVVFVLHEGTKIRTRAQHDEWIEIILPDGKVGWIRRPDVGII